MCSSSSARCCFDEVEMLPGYSWWEGIYFVESQLFLYGNISRLKFHEPVQRPVFNSAINRNFNIVVQNEIGYFLRDSELRLYNTDGNQTWKGITDSLGEACFNMTFTDANYTDMLRLEASDGNFTVSTVVGLLSDTPVIMRLHYFVDLNADGRVDIIDVSIVAKAFDSKSGDSNWNPDPDLNKDHVVNIVDVALVAKDFGKTV